jgi:hypothetical protein
MNKVENKEMDKTIPSLKTFREELSVLTCNDMQTGSGVHPPSNPIGTRGGFHGGKTVRA